MQAHKPQHFNTLIHGKHSLHFQTKIQVRQEFFLILSAFRRQSIKAAKGAIDDTRPRFGLGFVNRKITVDGEKRTQTIFQLAMVSGGKIEAVGMKRLVNKDLKPLFFAENKNLAIFRTGHGKGRVNMLGPDNGRWTGWQIFRERRRINKDL